MGVLFFSKMHKISTFSLLNPFNYYDFIFVRLWGFVCLPPSRVLRFWALGHPNSLFVTFWIVPFLDMTQNWAVLNFIYFGRLNSLIMPDLPLCTHVWLCPSCDSSGMSPLDSDGRGHLLHRNTYQYNILCLMCQIVASLIYRWYIVEHARRVCVACKGIVIL